MTLVLDGMAVVLSDFGTDATIFGSTDPVEQALLNMALSLAKDRAISLRLNGVHMKCARPCGIIFGGVLSSMGWTSESVCECTPRISVHLSSTESP